MINYLARYFHYSNMIITSLIKPIKKEIIFFLFFLFIISFPCNYFLAINISSGNWSYLIEDYVRNITFSFFISYLFTLFVYFAKGGFIKWTIYIFAILLLSTNIFLKIKFDTNISPLIIQLIGETTQEESTEFINTFLLTPDGFISIIISAILILLFYLGHKKMAKKLVSNIKVPLLFDCLIIFVIIIGGLQMNRWYSLFKCKSFEDLLEWNKITNPLSMDLVTQLAYSLQGPKAASNENNQAIKSTEEGALLDNSSMTDKEESVTVVYILGESFIKWHSNIYGYPLETCPTLSQEINNGNLFAFTNVVSPFNATSDSEKNTFSCNSIADDEKWYEKPFFPMLFKDAGYDVFMYDNQKTAGTNGIVTFSINSYLYNKRIKELSYTEICEREHKYDGELIDDFIKNSSYNKDKNSLIIFHLYGQHHSTKDRFPNIKRFNKFSADSIKNHHSFMTNWKKQLIASYDNATFYNDYVIGKIINYFRNTNAVVIYFPDHGEEIYDYRDSMGRANSNDLKNFMKYQFEIPLFIWCSNTYKDNYPDIIEAITKATNKPIMTDNICNVVFTLGALRTPYYIADRDFINPTYKPKKRIVNKTYNFDMIRFK